MPKYGVFHHGHKIPYITFEGDSFLQQGEFVEIFSGKGEDTKVVAAIRLKKGESVQEILS